jgi:hypothetical protein
MNPLPTPGLSFFANLRVQVGSPQTVGQTLRGLRRVIPILGGQVKGQGWDGRVLPGGADFQLIFNATSSELDARYVIELDGGDLIYVRNHALRSADPEVMARLLRGEPVPPDVVYFRCMPCLETASGTLGWVNDRLFMGTGVRHPDSVQMTFFSVD